MIFAYQTFNAKSIEREKKEQKLNANLIGTKFEHKLNVIEIEQNKTNQTNKLNGKKAKKTQYMCVRTK